ncbi:MAG: hypothetical protein KA757_07980 [Vogesella sp.]|nr:hypothetical protein [Vogesella sp.]
MTHPALPFAGCEFATFRAADGVKPEQLLAASQRMRQQFLQLQHGFIDNALLQGDDGLWADVVLADSRASAEAICQLFMQNEACLAYLALIAPDSARLTFWTRYDATSTAPGGGPAR